MNQFKRLIVDLSPSNYLDDDGHQCGRPDVDATWNADVERYMAHCIRQYNNDVNRGTDKFCLSNFLNQYSISINVFGLHAEMDGGHSFNRLISLGWEVYNDHLKNINS